METQGAAKEDTSEARGAGRGPGVRGPGAGLGQHWSRKQRGRGLSSHFFCFVDLIFKFEEYFRSGVVLHFHRPQAT